MDLSEHGEGFEAAELLRRRKKKKTVKATGNERWVLN